MVLSIIIQQIHMTATVIQNTDHPLGELMRRELISADKFSAASAFLNSGGLDYVMPAIRRILEGEGEVNIVHGADFRITDPFAMERLVTLNQRYARMTYKVHLGWDLTQSHRFHPKLYFWTSDYSSYTAVVGSSNLTRGGLVSNTEVNTIIRGQVGESPITQCLNIFNGILLHPDLVTPNQQFVEKYAELHRRAQDLPVDPHPPGDLQDLYQELAELRKPPATDWQPATQLEFVVKALENLESRPPDPNLLQDGGDDFVHLKAIYAEVVRLAREAGKEYDWSAIETSIRGRINENIGNPPETGSYFIREGGMSGRYRISDAGWTLVRERGASEKGDQPLVEEFTAFGDESLR